MCVCVCVCVCVWVCVWVGVCAAVWPAHVEVWQQYPHRGVPAGQLWERVECWRRDRISQVEGQVSPACVSSWFWWMVVKDRGGFFPSCIIPLGKKGSWWQCDDFWSLWGVGKKWKSLLRITSVQARKRNVQQGRFSIRNKKKNTL